MVGGLSDVVHAEVELTTARMRGRSLEGERNGSSVNIGEASGNVSRDFRGIPRGYRLTIAPLNILEPQPSQEFRCRSLSEIERLVCDPYSAVPRGVVGLQRIDS